MDLTNIYIFYENVNWFAEDRAQCLVTEGTKRQITKPNDFWTVQPTYIPYVWGTEKISAEIVMKY
jgi:hypothetical protein